MRVPHDDRGAQLELAHAQLSEEHRTLMSLLERLKRRGDGTELEPLLEELHTTLVNHFAHEQFPGGLYESMGAYGSVHHGELRVLIKDHCVILSAVRGLLEKARMTGAGTSVELREGVAGVVAQLEEHEHREHSLADKLLADVSVSVGAPA
jgi:hypothetical protein